jgi:hypothetical protein
VAEGIPYDAWCSPVWYAKYLPRRFGDGIWWQWQPSCFISVLWHQEALYRQGVRALMFWFSFVLYFCQVWIQHLSKVFDSRSSHYLLLHPSHHLGSSRSFV